MSNKCYYVNIDHLLLLQVLKHRLKVGLRHLEWYSPLILIDVIIPALPEEQPKEPESNAGSQSAILGEEGMKIAMGIHYHLLLTCDGRPQTIRSTSKYVHNHSLLFVHNYPSFCR